MALIYSVDELLGMRNEASAIKFDVKKLNPNVVADVVKVSENVPPSRNRDNSLIFHSSDSTTSHSGTVRSRSEAVNIHSSSDDDRKSNHPSQRFPRQWRLQKRSSSDSSCQPSSAPAGIVAQKAENFKKFYEAVISPTHVRVTAGGRIVPNFHSLTQPMFTWNSQKKLFELAKQSVETGQHGPWLQGPSLTLTDHSSAATATRLTCDDGYCSPSNSQTLNTCDSSGTYGMIDSMSVSENSSIGITASNSREHIDAVKGTITLSPPSQFDASRPFSFRGQLVYAVPLGPHPYQHIPTLPVGTFGPTNAYYQQHGVQTVTMLHNFPQFQTVNSSTPQKLASGSHPGPPTSAPIAHLPTHSQLRPVGQLSDILPSQSLAPELGQPIAIVPSAATLGHQIYSVQQELMQVDNQLRNNGHQIDERYWVNRQTYLRNQLSHLQAAKSAQTLQPTEVLCDEPQTSNLKDVHVIRGFPVTPSTDSIDGLSKSNSVEHKAPIRRGNENIARKTPASGSETDKSLKMNGIMSTAATPFSLTNSLTQSESSSRQRLRAAAAMAPPFQPRSQLKTEKQSTVFERKIPDSAKAYRVGGYPDEASVQTKAPQMASIGDWITPKAENLSDRATNFLERDSFNNTTHGNSIGTTVPYLVGFPPSESPLGMVDQREMVYSRQLTEEEIRARHLYWGRAPYEATKGSPKFDGRDFYPPSPVKVSTKPAMQTRDLMTANTDSFESPADVLQLKYLKPERTGDDPSSLRGSDNNEYPFKTATGAKWASFNTVVSDRKSVTNDSDQASLKSWNFTKAEEDEIFSSTGRQIPSSKQKPSSDSIRPANMRPLVRSATLRSSQSSVLQGMLKNNPGTTMAAATGALSSATARGFLPQYRSAATSSLPPSMSSFDLSSPSHSDFDNNRRHGLSASSRNENCDPSRVSPAQNMSSAIDFLQKVKRQNRPATEHGLRSPYH